MYTIIFLCVHMHVHWRKHILASELVVEILITFCVKLPLSARRLFKEFIRGEFSVSRSCTRPNTYAHCWHHSRTFALLSCVLCTYTRTQSAVANNYYDQAHSATIHF